MGKKKDTNNTENFEKIYSSFIEQTDTTPLIEKADTEKLESFLYDTAKYFYNCRQESENNKSKTTAWPYHDATSGVLNALFKERIELSFNHLTAQPNYGKYQAECERSEKEAKSILDQLSEDEQQAISQLINSEKESFKFRIKAAYEQGIKDGIQLQCFFNSDDILY